MTIKKLALVLLSMAALSISAASSAPGGPLPDNPYTREHFLGICKAEGVELPSEWKKPSDICVTTAMKNLQRTYVGENYLGPEPPGLNRTVGSYTEACVWFETIFGREVPAGNAYIPAHMEQEPDRIEIARLCAHAACVNPRKSTDVGRRYTPANYDEALVPSYSLPDPLKMQNGKPVRSARQWMRHRRPELLSLFEKEMFGRAPGRPEDMWFETLYRDDKALGGKAVRKEVRVHFDRSGKHYLRLLVYTPSDAKGPVATFLGINFKGNWAVSREEGILMPTEEEMKAYGRVETLVRGEAESRWPLEMITSAGYGVATFYRGDIDPDYDDGFQNGVHPLYYRDGQDYPDPDEWGTIAAWAWGLRRALDYLETDPDVDARRVAVIGHSRLGKTALWAGAQDERFAMVISNNSGNCGAALSRRHFGETLLKVNRHRPQWFCDNFLKYNENEASLPFDQHELIALCAPRPVYVASGTEDINADPKGEFLALKEASAVYRLFGKTGLDGVSMPEPDTHVGVGALGYHVRTGKHDITAFDWQQYILFAEGRL
ncbi:MAG: acetylxylan esterase [Bacteroidales bacterium]|nr:acetylxylan esterase [Bacteroidales bacterium]